MLFDKAKIRLFVCIFVCVVCMMVNKLGKLRELERNCTPIQGPSSNVVNFELQEEYQSLIRRSRMERTTTMEPPPYRPGVARPNYDTPRSNLENEYKSMIRRVTAAGRLLEMRNRTRFFINQRNSLNQSLENIRSYTAYLKSIRDSKKKKK